MCDTASESTQSSALAGYQGARYFGLSLISGMRVIVPNNCALVVSYDEHLVALFYCLIK